MKLHDLPCLALAAVLAAGAAFAQQPAKGADAKPADKQPEAKSKEARNDDRMEHWQKLLDRLDTDKNHALSRAEWVAKGAGFEKMDANGDGIVTPSEIPADREGEEHFMQKNDANTDGRVTLEEWQKRRGAAFDKRDADHDGVLTSHEYLAYKSDKGEKPGAE